MNQSSMRSVTGVTERSVVSGNSPIGVISQSATTQASDPAAGRKNPGFAGDPMELASHSTKPASKPVWRCTRCVEGLSSAALSAMHPPHIAPRPPAGGVSELASSIYGRTSVCGYAGFVQCFLNILLQLSFMLQCNEPIPVVTLPIPAI